MLLSISDSKIVRPFFNQTERYYIRIVSISEPTDLKHAFPQYFTPISSLLLTTLAVTSPPLDGPDAVTDIHARNPLLALRQNYVACSGKFLLFHILQQRHLSTPIVAIRFFLE